MYRSINAYVYICEYVYMYMSGNFWTWRENTRAHLLSLLLKIFVLYIIDTQKMVLNLMLPDALFLRRYFSLGLGFPANCNPVKHVTLLLDYLRLAK